MAKIKKKRGSVKKAIKKITKKSVKKSIKSKKTVKKSKLKKLITILKPKKQEEFSSKIYSTDIDRFYEFIKSSKKVQLKKAATKFKINKKTAEDWSKILQEHSLIEIAYPVFGGPELLWKK
ncbi:MAG: hypothetical protein ABIH25_00750 [Candidatus Woesearchaeota archaeon]